MSIFLVFFLILIFLGSFAGTFILRCYALSRNLIDTPNHRSSHVTPTPRGGGVAIVATFLLALPYLYYTNLTSLDSLLSLSISGLSVAAIGFLDDHGHIPARWRLLGHFSAALGAVFFLNGMPVIYILGHSLTLGVVGYILAALYLTWMLNLYNFMDGIDGLAGVEAVSVCLLGAILYLVIDVQNYVYLPLALGSAVLGFLVWNYPPAKIFMGDAGSGFLGVTIGVLSLQAAWLAPQLIWCWIILLGVFIVDATFTLIRRLFRGDKIYEAHRSHAYQFAARRYKQHKFVTLSVLTINCLWLFPVSLSVATELIDGFLGMLLAYLPLVLLALKFRAGQQE